MTRTSRTYIAAAVVCLSVAVASMPGVASATGEKFQDVFIRNAADSEAIPTRAVGSTTVENATGTSLSVQGTADVSGSTVAVTGAPGAALPVQVTNLPADAQTTTYQQRFFVAQIEDTDPAFDGLINSERLLKMDPGEKLTITHISGGGGGMHDALNYLRLLDWCRGEQPSPVTNLPIALPPNAEGAWPVVMQSLRFEIAPGHCLHVEARRQKAAPDGLTYPITIVGYVTKVG